jgi:hypothetical protein
MQNQKPQSLNAQEQALGPVEIDASLLHLIGGGAPKGTWSEQSSDAPKGTWNEALSVEPAPKGTW